MFGSNNKMFIYIYQKIYTFHKAKSLTFLLDTFVIWSIQFFQASHRSVICQDNVGIGPGKNLLVATSENVLSSSFANGLPLVNDICCL